MSEKTNGLFVNKVTFSNTYFTSLPNELLYLIDRYYLGPLELTVHPYSFVVNRFDSHNRLDIRIELKMDIPYLFRVYDKDPEQGHVYMRKGEVSWKKDFIYLDCDHAQLSLYGRYMTELFWSKVRRIDCVIAKYKIKHPCSDQIYADLFRCVF